MNDGIAIIGMGCRYPDANTPAELWENILAGRRSFRRIPSERLALDDYYAADRTVPDRTYGTQAALLRDYDFDRLRFRVAGSTYRSADIAHWLALDVAADALADAGCVDAAGLPLVSTGVILGNTLTGEFSRANVMRLRWPYVRRVVTAGLQANGWDHEALAPFLRQLEAAYKQPFPEVGAETLAGGLSNTIAGRICNHFDFNGGGYTVDGACSASLLAVIQACTQLLTGDLDVALAGGVDLSLDPFELVGFAKVGALAADDMRIYDRRSAGFWPGEGCGVIVLMRHADAVARGARIYGVIRGWGVSSDGQGGITRPEPEGQRLALERAYRRAGFAPHDVGLFEGHGTGTQVGDLTELTVLSDARRGAAQRAAVGSIKANIGHTKAAAGIAGLIKATLAAHHGLMPPTTGCHEPHDLLKAGDASLRVLDGAEVWSGTGPRRAGVSAMGFGGINTHVVLEHAPERSAAPSVERWRRTPQDAELFLFAAGSADLLTGQVARVAHRAPALSRAELTDLAAQLAADITPAPWRAAVVAATPDDLHSGLTTLNDWIAGRTTRRSDTARGVFLDGTGRPGRIGLLFPGQASPVYAGSGALGRRFPQLAALHDAFGLDIAAAADRTSTAVAQPSIAATSAVAIQALAHLGITAHAALGHSLGELAALHWAGAMDAAALVRLATARGRAMADLGASNGAMAGLRCAAEALTPMAAGLDVVVTGYNGPQQTVVSGPVDAIDTLVERAAAAGIAATRLPVSHAFHSPLVAAAIPALRNHLLAGTFTPRAGTVFSTVTGSALAADADVIELLCTQVTAPVQFEQALTALAHHVDLLIEAGPGTVLSGLAAGICDRPVVALDAGGSSCRGLLTVAGAAHALGALTEPLALFADRFVRPFDFDHTPRFLSSPCEEAPDIDAILTAPDPEAQPQSDVPTLGAAGRTPLDVVTQLVAARVELPLSAVEPQHRLLGDLHLNSITVGELVAAAARELHLAVPAAPTMFANATVAELAAALETLAASPEDDRQVNRLPAGVASWIAPFRIDWRRSTATPRPTADPAGNWQICGADDDSFVAALRQAFDQAVPGTGVVLCVPAHTPAPSAVLLDAAHRAAALNDGGRFLLVQRAVPAAALARTLHLEYPDLAVRVVTLPADAPTAACAAVVAEAAAASHGFEDIRYTADGARHEATMDWVDLPSAGHWPFDAEDVLVVTGGGKGIAFECALAAAQASGVRLGLLGRSDAAVDTELAGNLARLDALDIHYAYASADVTDAAAVRRAVTALARELGPITALWHAAGLNRPQRLADLDAPAFDRTVAPKVAGLDHALQALDPQTLRQLVTFGSLIGRAGLAGQGDYAIANEWLSWQTAQFADAHPHCRCLAVEWTVWEQVGMGHRLGRIDALLQQGITPIPTAEGVDWLRRLLATPTAPPRVLITGRYGNLPTLPPFPAPLPLWRFCEQVRVAVPHIELVVDAELSADRDPYLDDHMLQGERLLPAVMGLEAMAEMAMALSGSSARPCFENVQLERPIVIPQRGSVTLRVAVLRRDAHRIDAVLRCSTTGYQADHFRATCVFEVSAATAPAPAPPAQPVTGIDIDPATELYDHVLFHQGRFRRIARYRHLSAHACMADIAADGHTQWFAHYLPSELVLGDPAARDAAIHAIQPCIPHARLLPVGVQRIATATLAPASASCVIAREIGRDDRTLIYDMAICDADGRPLETWHGLQLRIVEDLPTTARWNMALLGPYAERRVAELLADGTTVAFEVNGTLDRRVRGDRALQQLCGDRPITRAANGRPLVGGEPRVSIAHAHDLTLAVAGADAVGCDLEPVAPRERHTWLDLLGADRLALADRVATERHEPLDAGATRVWAAHECLRKVGAALDAPLTLDRATADGWVVLRSGRLRAATYLAEVNDLAEPVVMAILMPDVARV